MSIKVGFIGAGIIGKPIAMNVMRDFPLTVYDINPKTLEEFARAGASIAKSAKDVGESADIIGLGLKDDEQVRKVILGPEGILAGAKPGTIIVIHSTIEPETAVSLNEIVSKRGVSIVDAPISGGREGAAARTLLYMVGGTKADFERCRPVFETSGTTIIHMGPVGAGAKTRIVHHVMLALNRFSADEGMKLAKAIGLDLALVSKAVHGGEAQSHVVDRYLEKYRDMPTGGQYRVAGIAMRLGYDLGIPMLGPALYQQLYLPTNDTTNRARAREIELAKTRETEKTA
jgi:3-hydroxyisobutyrate dehydrogenase-like beta-hydroxyacid dehydrogenase